MTVRQGVVLDAGPFIALERGNRVMVHLAQRLLQHKTPMVTSAAVVAQIWRGGTGRQAPVALLLQRVTVVDLGLSVSKILGRMLGLCGTSDPIDAHIAFLARERGWPVLTSDAKDILGLDPTLLVELI